MNRWIISYRRERWATFGDDPGAVQQGEPEDVIEVWEGTHPVSWLGAKRDAWQAFQARIQDGKDDAYYQNGEHVTRIYSFTRAMG